MDDEKFQELVLQQLAALAGGQQSIETGQVKLQKGQNEIKLELRGIWEDIKRLDKRLLDHDVELDIMKR